MDNNEEIRKRMETYRNVLLVLNWICSIAIFIVGFVMLDSIGGLAIIIIIIAIILGIIGHFMVNVALAIPFILLNNGDYLAAIVPEGKIIKKPENMKPNSNLSEYKVNSTIELREEANFSSKVITNIVFDDNFKLTKKGNSIIGTSFYWCYVENEKGIKGWCSSEYLKMGTSKNQNIF